jgi:hypothetical protein
MEERYGKDDCMVYEVGGVVGFEGDASCGNMFSIVLSGIGGMFRFILDFGAENGSEVF